MIKLFRKDVKDIIKVKKIKTINELIKIIKNQEDRVMMSESALRMVENSLGYKLNDDGECVVQDIRRHIAGTDISETSDLLFGYIMYPVAENKNGDTFSKGRERVEIKRLTSPNEKINMSFGEFTRSGIFKNEYIIKPPRSQYDEYLPSCVEPGRVINRIEDDDGELEDIRIYNNHDISEDVIEKNSYVPTAPELSAVLGVVWQIKELGVASYLRNVVKRVNEKMENGNEWTCSSCRYCNKRNEVISNSKKMSEDRDVAVCSLTDVVVGRENIQQEGEGYVISNKSIWNDMKDGLFSSISITDGTDNSVSIECPFHDKNYKSRKLDKWITEKPRAVLPIICEGDKFIVMLEDIEIDITKYVKEEIDNFFTVDFGVEIHKPAPVTEEIIEDTNKEEEKTDMYTAYVENVLYTEEPSDNDEELEVEVIDGEETVEGEVVLTKEKAKETINKVIEEENTEDEVNVEELEDRINVTFSG